MKKIILMATIILFSFSQVQADDTKATTEDVYNLVIKAYEVVSALGEESFAAFNDPKGEFVFKDTYAYVQHCPGEMVAHPYAMGVLKGVNLDNNEKYPFNAKLCDAAEKPDGSWAEYNWPKPGETEASRKVAFAIRVEGTPYSVFAGIYSDTANVEELNKTLH